MFKPISVKAVSVKAVSVKAAPLQAASLQETSLQRGQKLYNQGRLAAALTELRSAVVSHPDSPEAHFYYAGALADSGHQAQAVAHYRESISLNPSYAAAHVSLGTALYLAGNHAGARIAETHGGALLGDAAQASEAAQLLREYPGN